MRRCWHRLLFPWGLQVPESRALLSRPHSHASSHGHGHCQHWKPRLSRERVVTCSWQWTVWTSCFDSFIEKKLNFGKPVGDVGWVGDESSPLIAYSPHRTSRNQPVTWTNSERRAPPLSSPPLPSSPRFPLFPEGRSLPTEILLEDKRPKGFAPVTNPQSHL